MAASAGQGRRSRLAGFLDWLTRPSGRGRGKRQYDGYADYADYRDYRRPEPRVIRPWQVEEAPAAGSVRGERVEEVPASALDATHVSGEWAGVVAPRASAPLDATHTTTVWSNVGQPAAAPWTPDALWRPSPDQQPATAPTATPVPLPAPSASPLPPPRPAQPPTPAPAPRTLPPMADTGSTAHPARRILAEWPILLILGGVAFGMSLALGDNDSLLSGTFVIGVTLVLAAALRLFLPTRTAGSLAIRRKAIDVAMYTSLGSVMVALGLLVQGIFGGSGSL